MHKTIAGVVAILIGTFVGCNTPQEFYLDFTNGITARQLGSGDDAEIAVIYLGDFENGKPVPEGFLSLKGRILSTHKVTEQDFLNAGFLVFTESKDLKGRPYRGTFYKGTMIEYRDGRLTELMLGPDSSSMVQFGTQEAGPFIEVPSSVKKITDLLGEPVAKEPIPTVAP